MSVTSSLSNSMDSEDFENMVAKGRGPDIRRDCIVCRDIDGETVLNLTMSKLLEMIYLHSAHIDFCLRERIDEGQYHMNPHDYLAISLFQNFFSALQVVMRSMSSQPISQSKSDNKKHPYVGTTANTATETATFQQYVAKKFLSEKDARRPPSRKISRSRGHGHGGSGSSEPKTSALAGMTEEADKVSRQPKDAFTTYTKQNPSKSGENKQKSRSGGHEEYTGCDDISNSPLVRAAAAAALEMKQHRKLKEKRKSENQSGRKNLVTAASVVSSMTRRLSAKDATVVEKDRPRMGEEDLHRLDVCEAARAGNMDKLRELLDEGDGRALLKLRDGSNMNALDHACAAGQLEVMRELVLICGVDVNCANAVDGYTAMHHACSSGSLQAVTFLLLVANAQENPRGLDGFIPFDVAATKDIKKFLLSRRTLSNRGMRGRSASVSMLSPMKSLIAEDPASVSPTSTPACPVSTPAAYTPAAAASATALFRTDTPTSARGADTASPFPTTPSPVMKRATVSWSGSGRTTQVRGSMSRPSQSSDESESDDTSSSDGREKKSMTPNFQLEVPGGAVNLGAVAGVSRDPTTTPSTAKESKTDKGRVRCSPPHSSAVGPNLTSWNRAVFGSGSEPSDDEIDSPKYFPQNSTPAGITHDTVAL